MNAIAEIDKSGRLVVPKKLREALCLVPGTRLVIQQEGNSLRLEPEAKPRGLFMKEGMWVFETGPLPPEHVNWVNEAREARTDQIVAGVTE